MNACSIHRERCSNAADFAGDVVADYEPDGVLSGSEFERVAKVQPIGAHRSQLRLGNWLGESLCGLTRFLAILVVGERGEIEVELSASSWIEAQTSGGR